MSIKKYIPTLFWFSAELSRPFRKLKVGKPSPVRPPVLAEIVDHRSRKFSGDCWKKHPTTHGRVADFSRTGAVYVPTELLKMVPTCDEKDYKRGCPWITEAK
jgi:hypothetical protein